MRKRGEGVEEKSEKKQSNNQIIINVLSGLGLLYWDIRTLVINFFLGCLWVSKKVLLYCFRCLEKRHTQQKQ